MKQKLLLGLSLLLGFAAVIMGSIGTFNALQAENTFGILPILAVTAAVVLLLIYQKLRRKPAQEQRSHMHEDP